jgi:YgiT-type zinc finger domain-containing protein
MKPFDKCSVCGGTMQTKKVEKLIKGGNNIATVKVKADICLRCGERLFSKEDVKRFEVIRRNLLSEQVGSYNELGRSYEVA